MPVAGLWRPLARGLRALLNQRGTDQDAADEVRDYIERSAAAHEARGLSTARARRAAELELGNATVARERLRDGRWENLVDATLADLRYAMRRLRTNPGFTAVAAITLALGIGATTAIFSAVNPILFEPLPYPQAGRIIALEYRFPDGGTGEQAFGSYREIAERSRSFETLAVSKTWQPSLAGLARPERIDGQRVTAAYFRVLGIRPAVGRGFDAGDDGPGGANVVVLSDGLRRRLFAADSAVVGRQVKLDDALYTVVGIMPPGFENVPAPSAEAWSLLQYDPSLPADGREWGHHLQMIGRLRPDVNLDQARRELDVIARSPVPEFHRPPYASMQQGLVLTSLQDQSTAGVRPALLGVLGAVALLLLIACVNVTSLMLARGARRRGEFAMRAALGASRRRMIRQLLAESLLVALVGAALGVVIAVAGVRALLALAPANLPRARAIGVHGAALAFTLGITTLVGVAVGVIPALQAASDDARAALREASHRFASRHVARRVLVVTEVALALVLLVGAGLLLRSLERLFAVSPGFDASHVLVMQVQTSGRRFDDAGTRRFFIDAAGAVRRVPGVERASFTTQLPLSGVGLIDAYGVTFERTQHTPSQTAAFRYGVSPGYFETMGIPLIRGRLFDEHDLQPSVMRPVVISEALAKREFSGLDPIGQRLRFGGPADRPWDVVVGVVGDVKQRSLATTDGEAVYVVAAQWLWADPAQWLVVRAHGNAAALAPAVRNAVWSVDKDQPVVNVTTMDALVAASEAQRRFVLFVLETFAVVALVLAATGIYGVLSGSVAERLREIGVRAALGASPSGILGLVMRQGMTLTAVGAVLGIAAAAAASRALVTLLFGVSHLDVATYAGVTGVLLAVSALACWVPAWRAARVDPAITLRSE